MPELPSGRSVGMRAENALDLTRQGNFARFMGALLAIDEPSDMALLVSRGANLRRARHLPEQATKRIALFASQKFLR